MTRKRSELSRLTIRELAAMPPAERLAASLAEWASATVPRRVRGGMQHTLQPTFEVYAAGQCLSDHPTRAEAVAAAKRYNAALAAKVQSTP